MTKRIVLLLAAAMMLPSVLSADEAIRIAHAKRQAVGTTIRTNAKITQLADHRQSIVARLPGHLESYAVQPGQSVRQGDAIAVLRSLAFSDMSARYIALQAQLRSAQAQLQAARTLYRKGASSQDTLNARIIALKSIESKRNALASQLRSLGIDPKTITQATDRLVLKAHASGIVDTLLVPLHANIQADTPVVTLIDPTHYDVIAYLSTAEASRLDARCRAYVTNGSRRIQARFVRLLPSVDTHTQRAQALFELAGDARSVLMDAFVGMDIVAAPYRQAVTVKASALTMFQGEWVVFVPVEHNEAWRHHDEEAKAHEEDEHEHEMPPYAPVAVRIIAYAGDDVAVEGISANQAYVSDGAYYVKSMLLKSSLGEHGH